MDQPTGAAALHSTLPPIDAFLPAHGGHEKVGSALAGASISTNVAGSPLPRISPVFRPDAAVGLDFRTMATSLEGQLPAEIWSIIFSMLNEAFVAQTISRVCRRFRLVARSLFHSFTIRPFSSAPIPDAVSFHSSSRPSCFAITKLAILQPHNAFVATQLHLPDLRELRLGGEPVPRGRCGDQRPVPVFCLSRLHNLTSLNLALDSFCPYLFELVLGSASSLRTLELSSHPGARQSDNLLSFLNSLSEPAMPNPLPALASLSFTQRWPSNVAALFLRHPSIASSLTHLSLHAFDSSLSVYALDDIPLLSNLVTLEYFNLLEVSGVISLLDRCPRLRNVSLALTDATLVATVSRIAPLLVSLQLEMPQADSTFNALLQCTRLTRLEPLAGATHMRRWNSISHPILYTMHSERLRALRFEQRSQLYDNHPLVPFIKHLTGLRTLDIDYSFIGEFMENISLPHLENLSWSTPDDYYHELPTSFAVYILRRFLAWAPKLRNVVLSSDALRVVSEDDRREVDVLFESMERHSSCQGIHFVVNRRHVKDFEAQLQKWRARLRLTLAHLP